MITLIFSTSMAFSANKLTYSMQDLAVLEKQGNFQELLEHAKDIRPSERGKEWNQMVEEAAEKAVKKYISTQKISYSNYQFIEKLTVWPVTAKSEFFLMERANFAELFFEKCFQGKIAQAPLDPDLKNNWCYEHVQNFWNTAKKLPRLGIKIIELLNKYKKLTLNELMVYAGPALVGKSSAAYCEDDTLQSLLYKNALLIKDENSKFHFLKNELNTRYTRGCLDSLTPYVFKQLNSEQWHKALPIAIAIANLDEVELGTLLTRYYLGYPKVGDTLTMAFKHIEKLGKNAKLRELVLSKLKKYHHLPGHLFSFVDLERRKILMEHLGKHFPEYMDYYARTCVSYLEGKQFPLGNPTIECHDLFKASKGTGWIDSALWARYHNIPKY